MTPIGELRVSIPVALTVYGLNPVLAYLISVAGNLIPVIFLLLFLEKITNFLSRNFKVFEIFFSWLFKRTRKKYNLQIKKFGHPILALFVAIPLPVTGAWTGCLIAFLFGIPFKKALSAISLGVFTAGGLVLLITKLGLTIQQHFGWQVLFGIIITIALFYYLIRKAYLNQSR